MNPTSRRKRLIFIGLSLFALPTSSAAHEPIFGIGPHGIFKDGIGLGLKYEKTPTKTGETQTLSYDLAYGLTADWNLNVGIPQVQKTGRHLQAPALGDSTLRTKWRFYRKDYPQGQQDQVALLAAVKLHTGDPNTTVPLGSGSTDYIGGITAGRESRTFYYFTDLRYRKNGTNSKGLKKGDVWLYGASFGYRFKQTEYWEPDLVWLVEFFGKKQAKTQLNGQVLENTGGQTSAVGPSFLWSYKNWMLTGGVAVQEQGQYRIAFGIENHR